MLRVFISTAVLWFGFLLVLLAVASHHVAAHWFTFAYLTAVAVALPFAWYWLEQYKVTASIAARLDAAEGQIWSKLLLHIEGAESAILMALASAMATAKDWVDTTAQTLFGLQPSDLDPFKDVSLLHSFFSNDIVPKIIAGVTFFAAVLHIKSSVTAAKIPPAPGTAATPAT